MYWYCVRLTRSSTVMFCTGSMNSWMPCTCASFGASRSMIAVALTLRCSSGLRLIDMRPLLSGGVGAVRADERGQALDRRIGQDDLGQLLLSLGHGLEADGRRRLRDALDDAGVLHREEALGDHDVEEHRQHQRRHGHQQRHASGNSSTNLSVRP